MSVDMLRLGTEQKQGVLLAGFVAVVLAAARWIEVSNEKTLSSCCRSRLVTSS